MLFIEIAHEELLDLQASRVPPRDANHERIRAGAAREAGRFRVQEKPLFGIERGLHGISRIRGLGKKQGKRTRIRRAHFRSGVPLLQGQVLAVMIPVDPRAEKFRKAVASGGSFRNAQSRSFLPARGAQRGNAREFVVSAQR